MKIKRSIPLQKVIQGTSTVGTLFLTGVNESGYVIRWPILFLFVIRHTRVPVNMNYTNQEPKVLSKLFLLQVFVSMCHICSNLSKFILMFHFRTHQNSLLHFTPGPRREKNKKQSQNEPQNDLLGTRKIFMKSKAKKINGPSAQAIAPFWPL